MLDRSRNPQPAAIRSPINSTQPTIKFHSTDDPPSTSAPHHSLPQATPIVQGEWKETKTKPCGVSRLRKNTGTQGTTIQPGSSYKSRWLCSLLLKRRSWRESSSLKLPHLLLLRTLGLRRKLRRLVGQRGILRQVARIIGIRMGTLRGVALLKARHRVVRRRESIPRTSWRWSNELGRARLRSIMRSWR